MRRVVIAALIACSGHPPTEPVGPGSGSAIAVIADAAIDAPPPPLDRDPARLASRAVAMMQAVAAALSDSGEDCAAAATKLDAIRGEFADLLAANAKMLADGRKADLKAAIAPRQAELDAAATTVFATKAIAACVHDATFTRAFSLAMGGPP
jgi:hypothetical protein